MKICLVSPKFDEHVGGMETHGYEFARYFAQKGYLASVITRKNVADGVQARMGKIDCGIREVLCKELTADMGKDLDIILRRMPPDTDVLFLNSTNWLPIVKKIKDLRKGLRIFVRSGGTDLVAGWVGDELDTSQDSVRNQRMLVEIINNHIDRLIINSEFSRNRFLRIGIKNEKLVKFIGGVHTEKFSPCNRCKQERFTILNVSRLVRCKGLDDCLKVIKNLSMLKKDFEFVIVGDGPEYDSLKRKADKLGLHDYVRFAGAEAYSEVHRYFNEAQVFLHMPIVHTCVSGNLAYAHVESMGRVLCEAAASGIPVVSTKVGGVPEVVDDEVTGYLVEEHDTDSAAAYIVDLMENDALRHEMGRNARRNAIESFRWDIIFKEYEAMFSDEEVQSKAELAK